MLTPLLDALVSRAERGTVRLHMPGHKGRMIPGLPDLLTSIDFTELHGTDGFDLAATGDLYAGTGPIAEAERLWAIEAKAADCFFLTGGGSQGVMAALSVCLVRHSDPTVVVDQRAHVSAYRALAIFGAKVRFLEPKDSQGPLTADDLSRVLGMYPHAAAVFVTNPTYYGVLSDVAGMADVCAGRGVPLIVDAAHGTHLLFWEPHPAKGAALYVCSAHKTLPSFGQSALLFSDGYFKSENVRAATSFFGSTSPSYLLMAGLDAARAVMGEYGRAAIMDLVAAVEGLRTKWPGLPKDWQVDPLRLTVNAAACGQNGTEVARRLAQRHGVVCEMANERYVVFIFAPFDRPEIVHVLAQALEDVLAPSSGCAPVSGTPVSAPGIPATVRLEKKPPALLDFFTKTGYNVLG